MRGEEIQREVSTGNADLCFHVLNPERFRAFVGKRFGPVGAIRRVLRIAKRSKIHFDIPG